MSGVSRLTTKYINCSDNFRFVDLKQNTVPYIAVMRFGAWLLIFLRKEQYRMKLVSIRAWMRCSRLTLCLTRSRRRWERTQPFLTVCMAIFQTGRFRSFVRSILPMITALSRIIWRSLSENCGKNSMGMRWISTYALGKT